MSSVVDQRDRNPLLAVLRRLVAGSLIGLALVHGFPPQAWRVLGPVLAHVPQVGSRLHLLLLPYMLLLLLEAAALPAGVLLLLWEVRLPGPHEPIGRQQGDSAPTDEASAPPSTPCGSTAPAGTAAGEAQDVLRAGPASSPHPSTDESGPFALHLALAASPPGEERETMVVEQQDGWSLTALLEARQPAVCLLAKTTLMQQLPALLTAPTRMERINEVLLACFQRVQEQLTQRSDAHAALPLDAPPTDCCVLISALVCQGKEQRGVLALLGPREAAATPLTLVPLRVEWQAGRWRCVPEQTASSLALPDLALVESASIGALLDALRQALLHAGSPRHPALVLLLRLLAPEQP